MNRQPHIRLIVADLNTPGPFLTLISRCSCGEEVARRQYDVRPPDAMEQASIEAAATLDADAANAHMRDRHGLQ